MSWPSLGVRNTQTTPSTGRQRKGQEATYYKRGAIHQDHQHLPVYNNNLCFRVNLVSVFSNPYPGGLAVSKALSLNEHNE